MKLSLFLAGMEEIENYAKEAREVVHQWLGLPISIGIGPTKTLAKAANKLAKDRRLGVLFYKHLNRLQKNWPLFPLRIFGGEADCQVFTLSGYLYCS